MRMRKGEVKTLKEEPPFKPSNLSILIYYPDYSSLTPINFLTSMPAERKS